jgi:hypothetical protein
MGAEPGRGARVNTADVSHGGIVFGLGVIWFGGLFVAVMVSDFRRSRHRATRQHSGPGKRGRL